MGRPVFKLKRVSNISNITELSLIHNGEHFTIADTGELYYKHYSSGAIIGPLGSGGGGGSLTQHFSVFITDVSVISPSDAIVTKVFNPSDDNLTLTSCETNATHLRVHVIAISTDTIYKPTVVVNGINAILTNVGICQWQGYADLNITSLTGTTTIQAVHTSGTVDQINLTKLYAPVIEPTVTRFVGTYPTTFGVVQTELKENDTVSIQVQADQQFDRIEIMSDVDCAIKAGVITIPASYTITISVQAKNLGNTPVLEGVKLRVRTPSGIWSNVFNTKTAGGVSPVELQHVIKLNNTTPVVNINSITYPTQTVPVALQQYALKTGEIAILDHTVTGHDEILYINSSSTLTIPNTTTFETIKNITANISSANSYNVSSPNLSIRARRHENGSEIISDVVIKIADQTPTYTINRVSGRLRSGGNLGTSPQDYLITVNSNQEMHPDFDISVETPSLAWAPSSSWNRISTSSATRNLRIHDNDLKINYNLNSPVGYNLAGKPVSNTITNSLIQLGGFVKRSITVYDGEIEKNFGVNALDSTKLVCTNYAFSDTVGNYTYSSTSTNEEGKYTILNPSLFANGLGNVWRNNDLQNANSNTTFMIVELEELP